MSAKVKKTVAPEPTPVVEIPADSAIFAANLNFVYNPNSPFSKHALMDVNLDVKRGEFVAIVGHTGSGKTTFVQHLNALIRVQSGNLVVLGHNLSDKKTKKKMRKTRRHKGESDKPKLKALRKDVGMVFQYPEYQLFADTVLTDVCFGLKNFGVAKEEREQLAREAIELVGLNFDEIKNKSPFDLSGGEKRRVALAGVLAMKPQLLVMDEPTAGLDPRGKKEILSLVTRLNCEQGVTVIMVSHDMDEVYENAHRVVVFRDGQIAYDLPPRQLFKLESEIESMNLEVPQMARFANALEKAGFVVPQQAKTVQQMRDAVVALQGGDNHAS